MQERKGWRAGGEVCAEAQQVQVECGGGGDECIYQGTLHWEKKCASRGCRRHEGSAKCMGVSRLLSLLQGSRLLSRWYRRLIGN